MKQSLVWGQKDDLSPLPNLQPKGLVKTGLGCFTKPSKDLGAGVAGVASMVDEWFKMPGTKLAVARKRRRAVPMFRETSISKKGHFGEFADSKVYGCTNV